MTWTSKCFHYSAKMRSSGPKWPNRGAKFRGLKKRHERIWMERKGVAALVFWFQEQYLKGACQERGQPLKPSDLPQEPWKSREKQCSVVATNWVNIQIIHTQRIHAFFPHHNFATKIWHRSSRYLASLASLCWLPRRWRAIDKWCLFLVWLAGVGPLCWCGCGLFWQESSFRYFLFDVEGLR